jgi:outer membrane receptor protein involved in Fe transport
MKNISLISTLRLRSSYGKNGNADIGNYAWRPTYSYGYNYNGSPGSSPTNPGNVNLTWEKNTPFNIGLDAGILDDRIFVSADYYIRKTSDLLLNVPVSLTTGFTTALKNIGKMENRGIEVSITAHPLPGKTVDWTVTFNIAHNSNKVTELYKGQDIISELNIYRVGEDFQSFYTRSWAGVNSETGDPLWYTDSTHTTTTSNISDVKSSIVGSAAPKLFGALTNTVSWKGFTLSLQFNYTFGNKVFDGWAFYTQSDGAYGTQLNRWQHPGDITDVPKYIWDNPTGSNNNSTRYLYDGDFIRLRDTRLSYDFSNSISKKLHVTNLRVYVEASNLWTWLKDDKLYFDPDVAGSQGKLDGISDMNIPVIKTISGGINIGF